MGVVMGRHAAERKQAKVSGHSTPRPHRDWETLFIKKFKFTHYSGCNRHARYLVLQIRATSGLTCKQRSYWLPLFKVAGPQLLLRRKRPTVVFEHLEIVASQPRRQAARLRQLAAGLAHS